MPGGKLRALWRKWRDRPEYREQELLSQPASPAVGSKPETIPIPSSQAARSYGNKHADKTCGFDDSLPAPAEATRGLGVGGSTQEARPPLAASLSAGVPSCQPRQATNSGDDACRQGPAGAAPHRASSLGALPPCHLLVPARYTGSARRSSCCAPVLPSSTLEGEISTQTSVESYDRALVLGEAVSPEFGTPGWERALTQQIAACTGLSTTASSRRASESAGEWHACWAVASRRDVRLGGDAVVGLPREPMMGLSGEAIRARTHRKSPDALPVFAFALHPYHQVFCP